MRQKIIQSSVMIGLVFLSFTAYAAQYGYDITFRNQTSTPIMMKVDQAGAAHLGCVNGLWCRQTASPVYTSQQGTSFEQSSVGSDSTPPLLFVYLFDVNGQYLMGVPCKSSYPDNHIDTVSSKIETVVSKSGNNLSCYLK